MFILQSLNAQTSQQKKILNQYYKRAKYKIIEKIEREHIPLFGESVDMIPYRVDDSYGFVKNKIKSKTKWLIEPKFEQVFAVYKEGAIVKEKTEENKWSGYGLINQKGEWIIHPDFKNLLKIDDMYFGIRTSTTKSLSDFYDSSIDFEEKSDTLISFLNQIKPLRRDKDLGWEHRGIYWVEFFDKQGNQKVREFCHDFSQFSSVDTLAWFRYGKTITVRGKSGKIHTTIKDSETKQFIGINNNTIIYAVPNTTEQQKEITYDFEGFTITNEKKYTLKSPYRYIKQIKNITQLNDTLFGLVLSDQNYKFISIDGEIMPYGLSSGVAGIYQSNTNFFNQNEFIVRHEESNKVGVINRSGQLLIPFTFDHIEGFSEGLSYAIKDNTPCFINPKGEMILQDKEDNQLIRSIPVEKIQMQLQKPVSFQDGLCLSKAHNYYITEEYETPKEGYVSHKTVNPKTGDSIYVYYGEIPQIFIYFNEDQDIKIKLTPDIEIAGNFKDGLAPIMIDKLFGFIDKTGKIVIQPEYEASASGGYLNINIHIPYFNGDFAYIKSWKGYIDRNGKKYYEGKRMEDKYNFSH